MIHGQALRRREVEAAERHMPRPGFIEASVDELVLHWFDIEDVPRLIVDPALTIKWLNVRAERELQRRRDVLRRGDLLMTCNPAHQVELIALLARCGNEAATLCLRSEDQDGHLLVSVQPLPTGRFGLVLRRSGGEFRPSYADLGSAFQLTRGEIRVLLQLADGLSAAQAAEQLCVSTETVRTHIRNLYAKLAVKNREGLLSRIRAYQM
ncbi:helix-turn-helix transcriptional regulator [Allosphingosinicella sp.]|uniref:helix-turn-helix transcriptional regulator n=1 Tax=Allosphingosinicella sp. TaxID=2823234 RepID=UPI003D724DB8